MRDQSAPHSSQPAAVVSAGAAAPQVERIEWASDAQEQAFYAGPGPLCCSGGFGSSKTYALCLKALYLSDQFPGNRGLVFRRVAKELRLTTQATFRKLVGPESFVRQDDVQGLWRFRNGSEILWMHMENPDVQTVLRGLEINWFFGDQAEEIDEEHFDVLLARLGRWDRATVPQELIDAELRSGREWKWRNPVSGNPLPPVYPMIAVNPDSDMHWVYQRFHPESPEWREKWSKRGYRMIQFDTLSNRFLPQQNKDALLGHDETFIRRYVRGEWGIPEGTIHTIAPESIVDFESSSDAERFVDLLRATCTWLRILDHGDSAPTVCLWAAVDRAGNVFVVREYYQPNKLVSYHRESIHAMSHGESYAWNLADPSIFAKGTGGQKHGQFWSVADEYSDIRELPQASSIVWTPADNNEMGTRNRINEYLRVEPDRVHPVTRTLGAPRVFFLARSEHYPQGCVHVIRETRAQRRVSLGSAGGRKSFSDERDSRIVDHAHDCLRYLIASRPPVATTPTPKAGGKTFFGAQQRMAKQLARQVRA